MCEVCNGKNGINAEYSWGISFHPCPNPECDIREKERAKSKEYIDKLLKEMESREIA